ncbi:MAG: ROK family protein [Acidobacteriota bacterium]
MPSLATSPADPRGAARAPAAHRRARAPSRRGLSQLPGLGALCEERSGLPVTVDGAGRFSGEAGGFEMLVSMGAPRGIVVDAGQTAIKASIAPGHRTLVERAGTPRIEGLVATAIARAAGEHDDVDPAVVLGLPCEMRDDGSIGPCSYEGTYDRAWVVETIVAAFEAVPEAHPLRRAPEVRVALVNDAVLAAASALPRLAPGRTLVLTLGFGPGAAIVDR